MTETEIGSAIKTAIEQVREKNPMAPSITNTVTQDFVANAQLAVGGSAAMLYMPDECEAMAKIAPSFYINMGTTMPFYAETLPRAAQALCDNQKPWVLDPVGIGLSAVRMECLSKLKQFKPTIIRGNASEIITLAKFWQLINDSQGGQVRGVDSTEKVSSAKARRLRWRNSRAARLRSAAKKIWSPTARKLYSARAARNSSRKSRGAVVRSAASWRFMRQLRILLSRH